MKLRRLLALPMITAGLLVGPTPAVAGGEPVVNETDHSFNTTDVVRDNDPCTNRLTQKPGPTAES
jgi:hypothetical protein